MRTGERPPRRRALLPGLPLLLVLLGVLLLLPLAGCGAEDEAPASDRRPAGSADDAATGDAGSDEPGDEDGLDPATPDEPDGGLTDETAAPVVGGVGAGERVPAGFEDTAQRPDDLAVDAADDAAAHGLEDGFEDGFENDAGASPGADDGAAGEPAAARTLTAVWVDLISPAEDGGPRGSGGRGGRRQQGEEVGCGDRVVAVEMAVEAEVSSTAESIRVALDTLLGLAANDVPSDLMDALGRSDLGVERVEPVAARPGAYRVHLAGNLSLGGVCDAPRVRAQLVGTAAHFEGVDDVEVFLSGEPLDAVLSARGGG